MGLTEDHTPKYLDENNVKVWRCTCGRYFDFHEKLGPGVARVDQGTLVPGKRCGHCAGILRDEWVTSSEMRVIRKEWDRLRDMR